VDGNSVVVQLVGRGEAAVGLTDSDDIAAGQRQHLPVRALPIDETALLIPNTVAVIRHAPHGDEARRLFEYLQSPPVQEALIAASALEEVSTKQGLVPDWSKLLVEIDAGTATLREIFLR